MDYKVKSTDIQHPLLKPVLEELIPVFEEAGIKFYIIGAVARDIILELYDEKSKRVTMDLDIAIAINDWSAFDVLATQIVSLPNFTKDTKQQQKFLYKSNFEIDIVPYGGIKNQNDKIFWPPDESFAMTVLGFEEVEDSLLKIQIDEEVNFEIVSLEGVFLLKLFAWKDRSNKTTKDAEDLGFLLNNYFNINRDSSFDEPYNKVYDLEDFTELNAGAIILGQKLNLMLAKSPPVKAKLKSILEENIAKAEESKLINQIIETNTILKFDDIAEAIYLINNELK
jgi:predicted nucleotidyltransferase